MDLSGLLPVMRESDAFIALRRRLAQGRARARLIESARPLLLAALAQEWQEPVVVLTSRPEEARELAEAFPSYLGAGRPVHLFPEPDALPYERLTPDPLTNQQRLDVLGLLLESSDSPIIVASARAALHRTLEPSVLRNASLHLRTGQRLTPEALALKALALGYQQLSQVEAPGEMARRGGIVDLFPPSAPFPVRIEFVGSSIESLRQFEAASQRSVALVEAVSLGPALEVAPRVGASLDALEEQGLFAVSDPQAAARLRRELDALLRGFPEEDAAFYAPLFHDASLLDYLPSGGLLVLDEPSEIEAVLAHLHEQADSSRQALVATGQLSESFPSPLFDWAYLSERWRDAPASLVIEAWGDEEEADMVAFPFSAPTGYQGRLGEALNDIRSLTREGGRILVVSQQARRLAELLNERGLAVAVHEDVRELASGVTLVRGSLSGGWRLDPGGELAREVAPTAVLLTDAELFGFRKQRRRLRRSVPRAPDPFLEFAEGDHVVHVEHGIARFTGITKVAWEGTEREYLVLEYAEADRLYVPSDQSDRVARYIGSRETPPTLNRLGSQDWAQTKESVRQSVRALAFDLLRLYAQREVAPGLAIGPDTVWQEEMEAAFPYIETPDQAKAVEEVKADMEQGRPMDRLVCGDVGYGKTEVALRAAFKAVMEGYQVAMLVPTTVLAQQHYLTFSQRLAPFPVRVDVLSRFRTDAEQREVLEGLVGGDVDIIIGTHRLLQKDVHFKNLGLVVVDEEQRFGVTHKEHLKRLRREVDILTLTATPIPRTLHMALMGVRDMSTIETPPEERLPIKTTVAAFEERLLREAIRRELERGGQVYVVHNRVHNIAGIAARVREAVPEASLVIGHGQMPEEELERVMFDFGQGKYDVLVCTTIIESGLDIPNVNTIIINQADRLGLAQLYQLRGRVGRSTERAYAYLFYDQGKRLTDAARMRLQTIFEAAELGAGFRIALRDLEIRGAGNLLGAEQSGYIHSVGFELYSKLLSEAAEQVKTEQGQQAAPATPPSRLQPTVDLPITALIPEDYVADMSQRLLLYGRLARAVTPGEVTELAQELRDRFGEPPEAVRNLLFLAEVKAIAFQARVQEVKQEGDWLVARVWEGVTLPRTWLEQELRNLGGGRQPIGQVRVNQVRLDLPRLRNRWRNLLIEVLRRMAQGPQLVATVREAAVARGS